MASPLPTRKQSVDLGSSPGPRVSRIRRDPPPAVKPKELRHPDEVNRTAVVVGVLVFALAMVVILVAFSFYSGLGWSLSNYTIRV
jgi:type VI protein secretion system component VasF